MKCSLEIRKSYFIRVEMKNEKMVAEKGGEAA